MSSEMLKGLWMDHDPVQLEELEVPDDATPLDFLQAVYRDSSQPMPRRMKAAVECLGYVHPKLAVTVSAIDGRNFAAMMEDCVRRSGRSNVIDAKASYAGSNVINSGEWYGEGRSCEGLSGCATPKE